MAVERVVFMNKVVNNKGIRRVIILTVIVSQFSVAIRVLGQVWRERFSTPSVVYWSSAASSADGAKLVALGNSSPTGASAIYTSTNSGATWVSNSAPFAIWSAVASSSDGNKLAAVANTGSIWISTNSGATWMAATNAPVINWSSVASSSDGTRLIAAAVSEQIYQFTNGQTFPPPVPIPVRPNGSIYTSTNSGMTWWSNSIPCYCFPNPGWSCVASSADGSQLFAASSPIGIYHSTNGGAIWTEISSPVSYVASVATSADGSRLLATGIDDFSNNIWATSTNSGQSWSTTIAPPGGYSWRSIASSADGIKLVTADVFSIYTSTDCGGSWITNDAPYEYWQSVASSADGSKLVALANWGKIYTWQYQPVLSLSVSPANAVVSWPRSPFASGFVLQQNSNLCAHNWTDVSFPITDDETNLSVTFDPHTDVLFFRLKK
jgi:hypothetical protein